MTHRLQETVAAVRSHLGLFLAIYSLPICSTAGASLLFRPHGGLVVALLIAFFVLVAFFQTLSTGRSETNLGTFHRDKTSGRFWIDVIILGVVYILVTLWPIGYALQEVRQSGATP